VAAPNGLVSEFWAILDRSVEVKYVIFFHRIRLKAYEDKLNERLSTTKYNNWNAEYIGYL
jgi:hypothetical protein